MKKISVFLCAMGLVAATGVSAFAEAKGKAEEGKKIYQQFCANCHGPEGKGDGPAAKVLNPKPADHSDGSKMCAMTDDVLFKTIKEGGASVGKSPVMPAWGPQLKEDQKVWDLVVFVRSLNSGGCKGKGSEKKESKK